VVSHPPAVGRAQDRESSPVKDKRSTTATQPTTAHSLDLESRMSSKEAGRDLSHVALLFMISTQTY